MEFKDIPVSTQTFTVKSNIKEIVLQSFFDSLILDGDKNPKENYIISVKYQEQVKGDRQEEKKTRKKKYKTLSSTKCNFLNCVTFIIQTDKKINVKIFSNGVFQLTGCKHTNHAKICMSIILKRLKESECFKFHEGYSDFIIYIKSAMRNIDFKLGFDIERKLLSQGLKDLYEEEDDVVIPDSIGNKIDIKIKIRLSREVLINLPVIKIIYPEMKEEYIKYKDCMNLIEPDKKKLELKLKDKFISISVFQNGKVILSAIDATVQEKYYKWFLQVIDQIKDEIKPAVSPKKTFFV